MARSFLLGLSCLSFVLLLLLSSPVSGHGGGSDDSDAGNSSPPPNLRAKPLVLVKIYCLILVFVGTFVGGISPYFLKWNEGFLVLGTQFSGGVFFGTAMMHFLSDSNGTFEDLTENPYPFAFMLACAGYLITMLADCVILMFVMRKRAAAAMEGDGGNSHQVKDSNNGYSQSQNQAEVGTPVSSTRNSLTRATSLGDSILLIFALCFHSVFEGIAIGVAETQADAWKALWTVSLHKIFAAIAMGIALLKMIPNRPLLSCVAYAFAFAISSPIGVAIGIVIDATTEGPVADWIYAISMGIACGVFVYVSINHLLSKGYRPRQPISVDKPLVKWLSVTLGVGVIAVVMIWDT